MGEPVTEEMLVSVERMCGVEYFPGDDVRAIVAEVRRLRALVTLAADACTARDWDMSPPDDFKAFVDAVRMSDLEMVMQSVKIASHRAGDAAGYARAERDVVAFITSAIDHDDKRVKAATQRGDGARANVYAAGHTALSLTRKRIEDHCHRGAAKDEAPRGEGDGR